MGLQIGRINIDNRKCAVEGCDQPHSARGYCNNHYVRWLRHGVAVFPDMECPHCATTFTPKRSNQVYCSRKCKTAFADARRDREQHYESNRRWQQKNGKAYYEKHKETLVARAKAYREKNPDYTKHYYTQNKQRINAKGREYYANNRDDRLMKNKEWKKANNDKVITYAHKRRAILKGIDEHHTEQEWQDLLWFFNYRCAFCGTTPDHFHRDHAIPLSRGGTNAISNILPSCGSCNLRKFNKTVDEFVATFDGYGTDDFLPALFKGRF